MKTRFQASAVLGMAMAGGPACAQSDAIHVYGRLNLGLESVQRHGAPAPLQDDAPSVRLSNYRSILGVRGSEALGGGLRLVFQVEGTVSPDTGAGAIAARDTRIGLDGRWGTLFGGNWPTPYNTSTASLDPFYPTTAGYMSIMGNGSAPSVNNTSDTSSFDRRQQNSLHYWTPSWHGLALRLAHGFNEEQPANGARPALDSAALILEHGPLYAALAAERHHDYQGPGLDDRGTRLALAWQFGPQLGNTRLAAIAEKLRYQTAGGSLERRSYYVSLSRQSGPHGLRFGIARAGDGRASGGFAGDIGFIRAGADTGALHATLGYEYALSKRTTLFAFHTRLRNDARGVYDFAINGANPAAGNSLRGSALGIRHAF